MKMIKISSQILILLLKIIFEQSRNMEKGKCCSCSSKRRQNVGKDYCPISLLPIFGKIFGRVIYNSLFIYFLSNRLFIAFQSGFLSGDPCIA